MKLRGAPYARLAAFVIGASLMAGGTVPAAAQQEHRLGVGDVIRISVFQNPDLTLETCVTEPGVVSDPLLGNIRIGGLSVTQVEKLISDGLRGGSFVRSPQVPIVVLQVRGKQGSVLAQVKRPDRFPSDTADMCLTGLLALAGGTSVDGADSVVVTGTRNGQPFRLKVALPLLFAPGGSDRDISIVKRDTTGVDLQPLLYVYGEVQRPGPMRPERGMTLMQQSLATGGGLTQRGTERGISVHFGAPDGSVQVLQLHG